MSRHVSQRGARFCKFKGATLCTPASCLPRTMKVHVTSLFASQPVILTCTKEVTGVLVFKLFFFFTVHLAPIKGGFLMLLKLMPIGVRSTGSVSTSTLTLTLAITLTTFMLTVQCGRGRIVDEERLV